MPSFIMRLDDEDGMPLYCTWSTISDAPGSPLLPREAFVEYMLEEILSDAKVQLEARLNRADMNGTSSLQQKSADDLIRGNRAGEGEKEISKAEIIEAYRERDEE